MTDDQKLSKCKYCSALIPADSYRCPSCGEQLKIDFNKMGVLVTATFSIVLLSTITFLVLKAPKKIDLPDHKVSPLSKAILYYDNGEYKKAERIFKELINTEEEPNAYYYMGRINEENGETLEAIENYEKYLEKEPLNKEARNRLGLLCVAKDEVACITENIGEIYTENKNNAKVALYYAIYEDISSKEYLDILKNIQPSNVTEYYYANKILGYHYYLIGENKKAIPYLRNAYNFRKEASEYSIVNEYINESYNTDYLHEGYVLLNTYVDVEQYTNAIKLVDRIYAEEKDESLSFFKEELIRARNEYNAKKAQAQSEPSPVQVQSISNSLNRSSSINLNNGSSGSVKLKPKISINSNSNNSGNWNSYMNDMEARVHSNWNPYSVGYSYTVTTEFVISKSGELLSHRVVDSSGSAPADRAALNALELTRFKPLPSWYQHEKVSVSFTFRYNVK